MKVQKRISTEVYILQHQGRKLGQGYAYRGAIGGEAGVRVLAIKYIYREGAKEAKFVKHGD